MGCRFPCVFSSGSQERKRLDRKHRESLWCFCVHHLCRLGNRMEPLAFFLTWTTYASWLPGDGRGWFTRDGVFHAPRAGLARSVTARLREEPVTLNHSQRHIVVEAIGEHCFFRGWSLFACECRSNHVHVVCSAPERGSTEVLRLLKSHASRCLSQASGVSRQWWTKGGSRRFVFTEDDLSKAVMYVSECQDKPRF